LETTLNGFVAGSCCGRRKQGEEVELLHCNLEFRREDRNHLNLHGEKFMTATTEEEKKNFSSLVAPVMNETFLQK
jgi:hypothetical protein